MPVELRDMKEIPIPKLLNTLEQVNIERFSGGYEETSKKLIIGVSSSIVSLLIILGIIARKWIAKWRGSKRTSEKRVELSLVNSAAGPKSVQRPNFLG